ncbi:hypothetical protein [Spirillospora sp. CA-294931]|uniref:hypothetical protein n=1 Tax=Spirillospora sp. CA-294931 TaxID=3240042 RepID=UPI003D91EA24
MPESQSDDTTQEKAAKLGAAWVGAGSDGALHAWRLQELRRAAVSDDASWLLNLLLEVQTDEVVRGTATVAIADADQLDEFLDPAVRRALVVRIHKLVAGTVDFESAEPL